MIKIYSAPLPKVLEYIWVKEYLLGGNLQLPSRSLQCLAGNCSDNVLVCIAPSLDSATLYTSQKVASVMLVLHLTHRSSRLKD